MKLFAARFGLRTRLIGAFLLVAAISVVTTATLTYREARSAILQQAQDTAVAQFRDRIAAQAVTLPVDPEQRGEPARPSPGRASRTPGSSSPSTARSGSRPRTSPPPA